MIVRDVPQVEENTCEVNRLTERGNLTRENSMSVKGENWETVYQIVNPQDLNDMGKAELLKV